MFKIQNEETLKHVTLSVIVKVLINNLCGIQFVTEYLQSNSTFIVRYPVFYPKPRDKNKIKVKRKALNS